MKNRINYFLTMNKVNRYYLRKYYTSVTFTEGHEAVRLEKHCKNLWEKKIYLNRNSPCSPLL